MQGHERNLEGFLEFRVQQSSQTTGVTEPQFPGWTLGQRPRGHEGGSALVYLNAKTLGPKYGVAF